jgi:hypothetical protein
MGNPLSFDVSHECGHDGKLIVANVDDSKAPNKHQFNHLKERAMHITKQSSKMKRYTQLLAMGSVVSSLSAFAYAHEGHDQMMQMDRSHSRT